MKLAEGHLRKEVSQYVLKSEVPSNHSHWVTQGSTQGLGNCVHHAGPRLVTVRCCHRNGFLLHCRHCQQVPGEAFILRPSSSRALKHNLSTQNQGTFNSMQYCTIFGLII